MLSFIRGLKHPFDGWSYLRHTPGMMKFAVIPVLLSVVVYVAVFFAFFTWFTVIVGWVTGTLLGAAPAAATTFINGVINAGWYLLYYLLNALVVMAVFVLAALTFAASANVIGAPFYDVLSARIEAAESGRPLPDTGVWQAIKLGAAQFVDAAQRFFILMLILLVSFALSFVPVVGTIVGVWVAALFLMDEYFDYPCARHRFTARRRWRLLRRNFGEISGFGVACVALLSVPLFGLIVIPAAVAQATRLFVRYEKDSLLAGDHEPRGG